MSENGERRAGNGERNGAPTGPENPKASQSIPGIPRPTDATSNGAPVPGLGWHVQESLESCRGGGSRIPRHLRHLSDLGSILPGLLCRTSKNLENLPKFPRESRDTLERVSSLEHHKESLESVRGPQAVRVTVSPFQESLASLLVRPQSHAVSLASSKESLASRESRSSRGAHRQRIRELAVRVVGISKKASLASRTRRRRAPLRQKEKKR